MFWVKKNPPPAHLFLISGDGDFGCILHRLRMNNYNILLATPGKAPAVLFSAATIMWQWPSLLKGKNLIGNISTILLMVHLVLGTEILRCHLKTKFPKLKQDP